MTRKLDLGAGDNPVDGAVTLDRFEEFEPDYLHDLTNFPYPEDLGKYDEIYLLDVLEHLPTEPSFLDRFFSEVESLLAEGGEIRVRVPYYTGPEGAGDLQHSRTGYSSQFHLDYVNTNLAVKDLEIKFPQRKSLFWNKVIAPIANLSPFIWEHTGLAFLFPAMNLEVKLVRES